MASRVNISIPDHLREAMRKYKTVNWSAVAADAFDREIAKRERREKEVATMNDAIARLRSSRRDAQHGEHGRGEIAGRQWAMTKAEWGQLEALEEMFGHCDDAEWEGFFSTDDAVGFQGLFVRGISPDEWPDRSECEEFWETWVEDAPCEGFVRGFAEGALDFFQEAKDQM